MRLYINQEHIIHHGQTPQKEKKMLKQSLERGKKRIKIPLYRRYY